MTERYKDMDDLLRDAQNKGKMFFTAHWLLRAVEQQSRNLPVTLAFSTLYHPLNHYPETPVGRN